MEIILSQKLKNPTIIVGFPGFGLVGTIASEFLIEHLKVEKVGKIMVKQSPAMVAVHQQRVIDPISLYYNKKYNMLLVHGIAAPKGKEWDIAQAIAELSQRVSGKEIISLEGVGASEGMGRDPQTFYYAQDENHKKLFEKKGIKPLDEGVIIGITGAMLSTIDSGMSAVFVETNSNLPDSKAAASLISVLDAYLGLRVDYKPLLDQAKKFEAKLKNLMNKSVEAQEMSEKKTLNYVG